MQQTYQLKWNYLPLFSKKEYKVFTNVTINNSNILVQQKDTHPSRVEKQDISFTKDEISNISYSNQISGLFLFWGVLVGLLSVISLSAGYDELLLAGVVTLIATFQFLTKAFYGQLIIKLNNLEEITIEAKQKSALKEIISKLS